jgi:hypothetical protein
MRNTSAIHRTLWVALLACPVGASAQDTTALDKPDVDPYFRESSGISSHHGPQVITRNIIQDSKGDFWLATWNGVMRYDGTTFTNVTNKEGLRRYRAFSVLEDHQDNIWLGTTGAGLYRYDGKTYTNFTTKDGLVDDTVLSMMQDRDNNIWFGGMGLTKYDGTTFTSFSKEDGFTSSDVNSISQAPDGTMWFGTRGALFHYDGTTFVNFTKKHGLGIGSYIPALIDGTGNLWFGGQNGVFHYDGKNVRHVFKHSCFSLFEDSQGNIWFVGGALKGEDLKPGTSVFNRFDPTTGLDNILSAREQIEVQLGAIFGLTEDNDGSIWFGTGSGIGRIDGDTVQYYQTRAWGPEQVTGAPDTTAGDHPTAWAAQTPDAGAEWLKLTYAQAVDVAQVRVHETFTPGAVTRITAASDGREVVLWSGDPVAAPAPRWLELAPTAAARTATITLHLDTSFQKGWNEIDAVELVGADGSRQWAAKAESSSFFSTANGGGCGGGTGETGTLLQEGSKGPEVSALQQALNSKLNPSPGLTVNGEFGPRTRAAVIQFQEQVGITVDGVVGPQTMAALAAAPTPPAADTDSKPALETKADVDPQSRESSG